MVHVIKVFLEDEKNEQKIRRLAVSSDIVCSFTLLRDKIKDLFQLNGSNMEMKWKDPENDFIILSSDGELAQALANADDGLLKVFVFLKKEGEVKLDTSKPKQSAVAHPYVVCDACEKNIFGDRYKCLQCRDFDICSNCNAADKHPQHDLIKLVRPVQIVREWVYLGARKMWKSMFGRCPGSFFPHCQAQKENPSTSSQAPQGQNCSPFPGAFDDFLKGDFVEAQKLFNEGFGNFLKHLPGVEVKLENCPFKAECKVTKPKTEDKASNDKDTSKPSTSEQNLPTKAPQPSTSEQTMPAKTPKPSTPEQTMPAETPKQQEKETAVKEIVAVESASTETGEAAASPPDASKIPPVSCPPGLFSSNAMEVSADDDWTFLLHRDEAGAQEVCATEVTANKPAEPEKVVAYPSLVEKSDAFCETSQVQTTDPLIVSAIMTMRAMGFTNEGGWLERLLITKKGNINEALDALYPGARM